MPREKRAPVMPGDLLPNDRIPDGRSRGEVARTFVTMRVPPVALDEIDARAKQRSMTRTEYMIRSGLGLITNEDQELAQRLEAIEQRLARAEEFIFGD